MSGSIVQLTGLDDFISPSQACVKPAKPITKPTKPTSRGARIEIEPDGNYYEVGQNGVKVELQKASITLSDCLACSGCVTSAESVLVEIQNYKELEQVLLTNTQVLALGSPPGGTISASALVKTAAAAAATAATPTAGGIEMEIDDAAADVATDVGTADTSEAPVPIAKTVVVSVSPQSAASLGVKHGVNAAAMARKIAGFLKDFGVHSVLDTTFGRGISLLESQSEFVKRFSASAEPGQIPMLASACPGWVCYAEKTHGDFVLPYISTTKSPQQVMGTLVKHRPRGATEPALTPAQIYHVAVMPCLDKKLEASRDDFYSDVYRTRDVDCVITTGELEEMTIKHGVNWELQPEMAVDSPVPNHPTRQVVHRGGGSGGYLEHVFRHAALTLFGVEDPEIVYESRRNPDFREVKLRIDGEVKLRFASAFGFKSIQTVVRQLKRGKCPYHYIEVMACPKGCNNGGGQLKPEIGVPGPDHIQRVEEAYNQAPVEAPGDDPRVQELYRGWLSSAKGASQLHTQYHAVEKSVAPQFEQW